MINLNKICNYLDLKYREKNLKEILGIDIDQAEIIIYINQINYSGRSPSIGEISRDLGEAPSTVSLKITDLFRRGYTRKIKDPNHQRERMIELTPKGKNLSDKVKKYLFEY